MVFRQLLWSLLVLGLICLAPALVSALEPLQPDTDDRCAVCGMRVAPFPNWVAAVSFEDGTEYFFDGPKDMFNFLFDLQQYRPEATLEDVEQVRVTEYYTLQQKDSQTVFFVTGSDVLGPMGQELVPVAGEEAVKTFARDHGHTKIMRFDGASLVPVELPQ